VGAAGARRLRLAGSAPGGAGGVSEPDDNFVGMSFWDYIREYPLAGALALLMLLKVAAILYWIVTYRPRK
jgi:hypothetical protein